MDRMSWARHFLAIALAILVPLSAIHARRASAEPGRLIRPCCCALATSSASPDGQARLERSSPCALSSCCAAEMPPSRAEAAEVLPHHELLPVLLQAPTRVDLGPSALARLEPLSQNGAPPGHVRSLILTKRSFLL